MQPTTRKEWAAYKASRLERAASFQLENLLDQGWNFSDATTYVDACFSEVPTTPKGRLG